MSSLTSKTQNISIYSRSGALVGTSAILNDLFYLLRWRVLILLRHSSRCISGRKSFFYQLPHWNRITIHLILSTWILFSVKNAWTQRHKPLCSHLIETTVLGCTETGVNMFYVFQSCFYTVNNAKWCSMVLLLKVLNIYT